MGQPFLYNFGKRNFDRFSCSLKKKRLQFGCPCITCLQNTGIYLFIWRSVIHLVNCKWLMIKSWKVVGVLMPSFALRLIFPSLCQKSLLWWQTIVIEDPYHVCIYCHKQGHFKKIRSRSEEREERGLEG